LNRGQTDNSHFEEKIKLRINNLPEINPLRVLDMFSGDGLLWSQIKARTEREIFLLRVEKKKGKKGIYLLGDNLKFRINPADYDIVDIDAYGIPFSQMEKILRHPFPPKVVFITWIQSQWGVLPIDLLNLLGYSKAMVKKIPTLFNRNGHQKLMDYLGLLGVKKVKMYHSEDLRKNYLCIRND
jgi:hypothetical protein